MDSGSGASLSGYCPDAHKQLVPYSYEPSIGDYYDGQGHLMKPHRIRMAHNLIIHYSLNRRLEISHSSTGQEDIRCFSSQDYVEFLASVSQEVVQDHTQVRHLKRFSSSVDCSVFDGLFDFCQASTGGSISDAVKLNRHQAKKSDASGFCYVNDIV